MKSTQAGFMHILAPSFLEPLERAHVPVINLHPALPTRYDGVNAIGRAWDDFQAWEKERSEREQKGEQISREEVLARSRTGVMIHYVITEVDRGEPIVVEYVDLRSGESLDDLTQRVHDVEHGAIVKGTGIAIARLWEERRKHEQAP
jgi:phosphoribosylglycinamide formyltransferase